MKKALIIIISFIVVAIVHTIGSTLLENRRNRIEEAYRLQQLIEIQHRLHLQRKFSYARLIMRFEPFDHILLNNLKEIVFVHSIEESYDFPIYVFVMWPSVATPRTIGDINYIVQYEEIDLERFGLIYPITIEDSVNYWENVDYLLSTFSSSWHLRLLIGLDRSY